MGNKGLEYSKREGLPSDAVPFHDYNATDITSTTAQTIRAAPGAGKCFYISKITSFNSHATETPVITLQDDAGTPVQFWKWEQAAGPGQNEFTFDPPLKTTTNTALEGVADGSTGDVRIQVNGWVGTADEGV